MDPLNTPGIRDEVARRRRLTTIEARDFARSGTRLTIAPAPPFSLADVVEELDITRPFTPRRRGAPTLELAEELDLLAVEHRYNDSLRRSHARRRAGSGPAPAVNFAVAVAVGFALALAIIVAALTGGT